MHAKGIAPQVDLAELVGLIRGVPPTGDLVEVEEIYPPGEGAPQTDEEWEALPPDSPFLDGPGIFELPASVRDTLADVDDERLPEPARQWAGADFAGVPILGGWCPPVPSSTSPARFSGT